MRSCSDIALIRLPSTNAIRAVPQPEKVRHHCLERAEIFSRATWRPFETTCRPPTQTESTRHTVRQRSRHRSRRRRTCRQATDALRRAIPDQPDRLRSTRASSTPSAAVPPASAASNSVASPSSRRAVRAGAGDGRGAADAEELRESSGMPISTFKSEPMPISAARRDEGREQQRCIAEIGLGDRAEAGDRAASAPWRPFPRLGHVGGVDEARRPSTRRMVEQPLHPAARRTRRRRPRPPPSVRRHGCDRSAGAEPHNRVEFAA